MPHLKLFFLLLSIFFTSSLAANVTYDRRSLIIDGQRKLLISASIHYPRSVPGVSFLTSDLAVFLWIFLCFLQYSNMGFDFLYYLVPKIKIVFWEWQHNSAYWLFYAIWLCSQMWAFVCFSITSSICFQTREIYSSA